MRMETLSAAIRNAHLLMGEDTEKKAADETAYNVLSVFGYNDRCLSNNIDNDLMALVYVLEDLGLVRPESRIELLSSPARVGT